MRFYNMTLCLALLLRALTASSCLAADEETSSSSESQATQPTPPDEEEAKPDSNDAFTLGLSLSSGYPLGSVNSSYRRTTASYRDRDKSEYASHGVMRAAKVLVGKGLAPFTYVTGGYETATASNSLRAEEDGIAWSYHLTSLCLGLGAETRAIRDLHVGIEGGTHIPLKHSLKIDFAGEEDEMDLTHRRITFDYLQFAFRLAVTDNFSADFLVDDFLIHPLIADAQNTLFRSEPKGVYGIALGLSWRSSYGH